MKRVYKSRSVEDTVEFAKNFAQELLRGDVIALYGELGSGKTQFVKGVCKAFNVDAIIASPSFVIQNRYAGTDLSGREITIYHFDLYRVRSENELYNIGYQEFICGENICLIEWANMLGSLLPKRRYDIKLSLGADDNEREIEISKVEQL